MYTKSKLGIIINNTAINPNKELYKILRENNFNLIDHHSKYKNIIHYNRIFNRLITGLRIKKIYND